jgi:hypothetical protein
MALESLRKTTPTTSALSVDSQQRNRRREIARFVGPKERCSKELSKNFEEGGRKL